MLSDPFVDVVILEFAGSELNSPGGRGGLSSGLKDEIVNETVSGRGRGRTYYYTTTGFSYYLHYQEKQMQVKVSKVGQRCLNDTFLSIF